MSEHNIKTIKMYDFGGALEYIQNNGINYLIMLIVNCKEIKVKELLNLGVVVDNLLL